jgi:hypothetical protein
MRRIFLQSFPASCLAAIPRIVPLLAAAWGGAALWYAVPGRMGILVVVLWCAIGAAALFAVWCRRWRAPVLPVFVCAMAVLLGWWSTLTPSHERIWADDVARLLHARVEGERVRLDNVRNFDWRSETDYDARWETREYDLDRLVSADLILSYWMGPAIAHTLLSFGFDDGRFLVFSLEIRKEQHESFSAVAGFFRRFESVIIAADERDIVRVRSNVRGEDVHLYRLEMPRPALRTLFLGYVAEAGELERTPRFYNTLTSNCTTIVFDLARRISSALPLDYRLLLSGYLAEYARDAGALAPGHDLATLRARGHINGRAIAAGDDAGFSQAVRRGVPGVTPSGQVW